MQRKIKVINVFIVYLISDKHPTSDYILKYSTKAESQEFAVDLYNRLFPCSNINDEVLASNQNLSIYADNPSSFIYYLNNTTNSIENKKK